MVAEAAKEAAKGAHHSIRNNDSKLLAAWIAPSRLRRSSARRGTV
jgi:hypothetical protein